MMIMVMMTIMTIKAHGYLIQIFNSPLSSQLINIAQNINNYANILFIIAQQYWNANDLGSEINNSQMYMYHIKVCVLSARLITTAKDL